MAQTPVNAGLGVLFLPFTWSFLAPFSLAFLFALGFFTLHLA